MIEEGLDVTSTSLGWMLIPSMTSYYQGDDVLSEKVNEAWENVVFPVFSAGNNAVGHLRTNFDDGDDDDDWHRFYDNIEINMYSFLNQAMNFDEGDFLRLHLA